MGGVRGWLLTILSASILCALADSLMPAGAVKRVGRLVCGLVLLCAILSPLSGLDLGAGRGWLADYFVGLELREAELEEQVEEGMKAIIEEKYAAYIVDKAAELGLTCTARVECRADEAGLYLPQQIQVTGNLAPEETGRLANLIREDLGVSLERQVYKCEEELP